MKKLHIAIAALGMLLVAVFCWGFWGFIQMGSSGPPSEQRMFAFWIGGCGYLVMIFFFGGIMRTSAYLDTEYFGRAMWKNFKRTSIALLCCFPAAFLFIGFLAPPFILAYSSFWLLLSSLKEVQGYDFEVTEPMS